MFRTPSGIRMSPGKKRNFRTTANTVKARLDRISAHKREMDNLGRKSHKAYQDWLKIESEWYKSQQVYNQLIRRFTTTWTGRKLNLLENEHLTQNEMNTFKQIVRSIKAHQTALRTVRRLPLPPNIGYMIAKHAAHLAVTNP